MRKWYLPVLLALAAAGGCVGVIGDPEGEASGTATTEPALAEATLHRLTRPQIQNAWRDLLGEPLAMPTDLPADDVLYGFSSISAARSTISPVDAEKYEAATYHVLDQIFADPVRLEAFTGCPAPKVGDACVDGFVGTFTAKAWRRPAAGDEVAALLALGSKVAADLGDPVQGLKFMLAGVLMSPHFLFRVEVGEPGPEAYRYTSWEMASRLSFLLLDAPPDADPTKPTTLRERLDAHRKDPACAGCHQKMDPIGFTLERFDSIGAYRDMDENNLPIDSASEIDGAPVDGPMDMTALIAALPEVGACVARRFYEHGGAHLAGKGDEPSVDALVADFVGSNYTFKELVLALVTNNGYRYASPPAQKQEVKP